MNKKLGIIAAIVCALALCLTMVGCGGGGVDKSKFVGTWNLTASSSDGMDEKSIELMKSLGLEVKLTLNEDETGTMNLFGEESKVSWKASSASEGTMTMDGVNGETSLKIDGENLVVQDNSSSMTFQKA